MTGKELRDALIAAWCAGAESVAMRVHTQAKEMTIGEMLDLSRQYADGVCAQVAESAATAEQVEALSAALSSAFASFVGKTQTKGKRARSIVAGIDSMAREHGGSAEFVSVEGDVLHYRLALPASIAAQLVG